MDGPSQHSPRSDLALVEQARAGSHAAFAELVERYQRPLFRYLMQRAGNRHDAEDALQEALVKAYRALHRYNPRWRLSTWLFTIAQRTLTDLYRRKPPPAAPLELAGGVSSPPAERPDGVWTVAQRILPPDWCAALWLKYAEDASAGEIAAILGRSSVWVRVSLFRARQMLARTLAAEDAPGLGNAEAPDGCPIAAGGDS